MKASGHRSLCLASFFSLTLVLAGCTKAPELDSANANEKPGGLISKLTSGAKPTTVPEGTPIHVTLDQTLASDQSRSGDEFGATVADPVVVQGQTVIPKGAHVTGRVVDAHESGRLQTPARLRLALYVVQVGGKDYEIETSSVGRSGRSHKNRNLALIGGGAGLGAIIGGVAGGGKGALIGSAAGAGAGTAGAAITGKREIRLPAETHLTFRLAQPVTISVKS